MASAHRSVRTSGALGVGLQVAGGDVAEGDGGHLLGEEEGDGFAGDFTGADDDGFGAAELDAGGADQFDDRQGGAGGDEGVAVDDVADVGGVDAFDVFDRVDLVLEDGGVEMFGQRQVEHDAGDGEIAVEALDGAGHFFKGGIGGEGDELVVDADGGAGFLLALGVELAGGGGTDENCGQVDGFAVGGKLRGAGGDLLANGSCQGGAVDDLGHRGGLYGSARRMRIARDFSLARLKYRRKGAKIAEKMGNFQEP